MTDKQLCYVYNSVISPIIECRSQLTLFSKEECHKLFTPFRIILKNKFKYSRIISNALIECRWFYDIKDIWFIQSQAHYTNLLAQINDNDLLGQLTGILIKELQINQCLNRNPLFNLQH